MKFHDTNSGRALVVVAVCAATLFGLDSQAQAAGEDAPDAERGTLEEVVITAQRRETNLQNTALAATVLSGDELTARGVDSLARVQYVAPSVNLSDFGSANVFNIRGVGRSKVDIEIPSGVVIYQDGIPTIAGYFQNEPYYDIGAIEVLRGPQGTFVGKSASGGAIFTRTRDPELNKIGGRLEVGGGAYGLFETQGVFNASSSDTFAFRAAFNYENRDDYYDDITGPYTGDPGTRDLKSARLGALWKPTDKLTIKGKVNIANLDFGGNVTSSYGDPLYSVPQDAPFAYRDESTRLVLDIDYAFDNGVKFNSLSGYQELDTVNNLDVNGSQPTPYWFLSKGTIKLWSQEFNLVSPDDQRFRWVLGAFAQNQKAELLPVAENGFVFVGGPFYPNMDYPWLGSPWTKDEDDWAVFAHLATDITDSLELETGLRYSDYKFYQVTDYVFGFGDVPPAIPFGSGPGPDRQEKSENSVDWKAALNWKPNDRNFVYGVLSRGHTTGSVNIFPPFDPYDEMEVINLEGGWKAAWNGNRFTTQVAAYYESIDGYQAAFIDLDLPNSAGQVQNAESKSKIYGLEITGQAKFDNFSWDFGVSWNESKLGDFNNVAHPLTAEILDLTGAPFPFAPDFTANIGVEYHFTLGNGSTLAPRADLGYVAETQAELFDDPEFTLAARALLNLQLRWEQGPWYATGWMSNATDKRYVAAIQNQGSLYYAGPPRQWGVRLGRTF